MIVLILEAIQLADTHRLTLFILFAIYAWGVWLTKILYARGYRPCASSFQASMSVIIPTYKEDPAILRRAIGLVLGEKGVAEVVIVSDEREAEVTARLRCEYAGESRLRVTPAPPGKREAVALGIRKARNDIVVVVESDTFLTKGSLSELIRPFADPEVGGVVANQRIHEPRQNLVTRANDWMEAMKYNIIIPATSTKGVVPVLGGRCVAFQREVVLPLLPRLTGERFLGKKCVSGDDGRLTSLLLEAGYKAVYQSTALVHTISPMTFPALLKQRTRWWRNSSRRTINAFKDGWVWKKHWLLGFQMILTWINTLFFGVIMVNMIARMATLSWFDLFGMSLQGILFRILVFLVGISLTRLVLCYPHLREAKYDLPLVPLYALYLMFIMWGLRVYSILTLNKQGWVTRKVTSAGGLGVWEEHPRRRLGRVALATVLIFCVGFGAIFGLGITSRPSLVSGSAMAWVVVTPIVRATAIPLVFQTAVVPTSQPQMVAVLVEKVEPTATPTVTPVEEVPANTPTPTPTALEPTSTPTVAATVAPTLEPTSTPTVTPAVLMTLTVMPTPADLLTEESLTYVVRRGDRLTAISESFYSGNSRGWRVIYWANRDIIEFPSLIHPGQVLVIPDIGDVEAFLRKAGLQRTG